MLITGAGSGLGRALAGRYAGAGYAVACADIVPGRAEETVAKLERIPKYVPQHARADWKRIQVPTLVLANRQDEIHPFDYGEAFAREISNVQLVEITPKSVSQERHTLDVRQALADFLVKNF